MSHILIIAPTELEMSAVASVVFTKHKVQLEVTGIGIVHTLHALHTLHHRTQYDWIIQCGVAGAIDASLQIGDTTIVENDTWGDMGAWEGNTFRSVFNMNLVAANQFPYKSGVLHNTNLSSIQHSQKVVSGVTCNQISTDARTILWLEKQGKQIETMEGAAFHFFCLHQKQNFLQVRSISNSIGERNKEKWNMKKALQGITNLLPPLLKEL